MVKQNIRASIFGAFKKNPNSVMAIARRNRYRQTSESPTSGDSPKVFRISDLKTTSLPQIKAAMQSSATTLKRQLEKSHSRLNMEDHTDVLIPEPVRSKRPLLSLFDG